jgi:hypothetical protein
MSVLSPDDAMFILLKAAVSFLLVTNPSCYSSGVAGPAEFVTLWNILGQWRVSTIKHPLTTNIMSSH